MPNVRKIFLVIKDYLAGSDIDGVDNNTIYGANVSVKEIKRDELAIQIGVVPLTRPENRTERVSVAPVMVNIFVCVPTNTGDAYASHIAALIASRFSEQSPDKCSFALPVGFMHVRGVSQTSGYVENSMYRIAVQVLFDVYETR